MTLAENNKIISEITSSSEGGLNENKGTTNYVDDSITNVASVDATSLRTPYLGRSGIVRDPSINAYLMKPYEVAAGVFAATDTVTTFTQYHFPRELLKQTMYHRKIQGFMGFRGTLVLKLQVNAERFQQGRYMLCAVPTAGALYDTKLLEWGDIHLQSRVQRSQTPHAEIDLATETSCELRLPFCMAQDFYSIQLMDTAPYETSYIVRIFPYVALTTGTGSVNAKYTLWAHYEDVELIGQALPVELQSGVVSRSTKRPSDYEANRAGVGPVQSVAMKISKASDYLAPIPMLSDFALPLKWASDLTANVASVFGWSAPANLEPQHRQKIGSAVYANNISKVDMGFPLSLDVNNSVAVSPELSVVKEDELDIAYLANKPSWLETISWTTSQAEDTLIKNFSVGLWPNGNAEQFTTGGITFTNLSPAQYLGTQFATYRGSVIFKFKFVKTEFHSGRLSFDFNPVAKGYTSAAITDSVAPYVYRDIVDIREMNEYVLEIPYQSNVPYLDTDSNILTNHFGRLDIRVIDPLVAPTTVNQTISIIVEHCLGKDAEFAILNKKLMAPIAVVELQSGHVSTIGNAPSSISQSDTACIAMGEKIVNLRAMLKRFYGLPWRYLSTTANGQITTIAPFCNFSVGVTAGTYIIDGFNDLYGDLSSMFALSRGGVRFKFTDALSGSNSLMCTMFHSGASYSVKRVWETSATPSPNVWSQEDYTMNSINYVCERNDNNSWTEVSVPQYSKTHSRSNAVYWTSTNYPMVSDDSGLQNRIFLQINKWDPFKTTTNANTPTSKINILRSGAEDVNFSFFISVPPMSLNGLGNWY